MTQVAKFCSLNRSKMNRQRRKNPHKSKSLLIAQLFTLAAALTLISLPADAWFQFNSNDDSNGNRQLLQPSRVGGDTSGSGATPSAASIVATIATAAPAALVSAPELRPPANRAFASSQQQDPVVSPAPSPLGKILDSLAPNLNSSGGGSDSPAPAAAAAASLAARAGAQLLKPRKWTAQPVDPVVAAEQQIISQHSRLHLSGGSHQRLLPTKHRDNKLSGALQSDSSARDSPLSSLFGSFKSGISSRSSIVKAISDNKLARTLSSVGKTLGGNKYVAGAAAASALAALGLTVSKLLGPYMLSSGYSKFGDPMMSSASFLGPATIMPPSYMSNDRNLAVYGPSSSLSLASDSLLTSGSSPQQTSSSVQFSRSQQQYPMSSSFGETYSFEPPQLQSSSGGSGAFNQASASSQSMSFYPSSGQQAGNSNDGQSIYFTYSPMRTKVSQVNRMQPQPQDGGFGANSGHYAGFYAQQGDASAIEPAEMSESMGAGSGGGSSSFMSPNQFQSSGGSGGGLYEQLLPAASLDTPTFSQPATVSVRQPEVSNSRRSGTVSLKMDEATRARLLQHLINQQQQQMRSAMAAATGSEQRSMDQVATGVFVAAQKSADLSPDYATSYKSSRADPVTAQSGSAAINQPAASYELVDNIDGFHPSSGSSAQQQAQGQQLTTGAAKSATNSNSPAAATTSYLVIRPNSERQQRQQQGFQSQPQQQQTASQMQSPEARGNPQQLGSSVLHQSSTLSSDSSPWRSVDGSGDFQSDNKQATGWQSVAASSKKPPADRLQIDKVIRQQQTQRDQYDQQPPAQVSANGSTGDGQVQQSADLSVAHRVSRTPQSAAPANQPSGKLQLAPIQRQRSSDLSTGGSGADNNDNNNNNGVSGSTVAAANSNSPAADPVVISSSSSSSQTPISGGSGSGSSMGQQQVAAGGQSDAAAAEILQLVSGQQQQKPRAQIAALASGGSQQLESGDSKQNLIQLNENDDDNNNNNNNNNDSGINNKNNVIKLIDASMSAGKPLGGSDSGQYDAGLVIMSPPSSSRLLDKRNGSHQEHETRASGGSQEAAADLRLPVEPPSYHHHHHNHRLHWN